jgi:nucleoside-triphosphatase
MMNAVLTGRVQIGKTTVCQAVANLARERGYCVQGILTPPILDRDGERLGIEVLDLASGERRVLAQIRRPVLEPSNVPGQHKTGLQGNFSGPQVGIYEFDAAALQWGQDVVARAIAVGCDLLIVDEIGRLELQQDNGFNQVLNLLETSVVLRSLLVVRAELLDLFRQRLPSLQFISFEVTRDNRYSLPFEIADRFFLA